MSELSKRDMWVSYFKANWIKIVFFVIGILIAEYLWGGK